MVCMFISKSQLNVGCTIYDLRLICRDIVESAASCNEPTSTEITQYHAVPNVDFTYNRTASHHTKALHTTTECRKKGLRFN